MVNLTSFALNYVRPASVDRLLDFFESAPHLREVNLRCATLTRDAQTGRLVSLACLKKMEIKGGDPPSDLLENLSIPVGARLTIDGQLGNPLVRDRLLKLLYNLRNFSSFTAIRLNVVMLDPRMEFSGPNGKVIVVLTTPRCTGTWPKLEPLAHFDTSKTERLQLDWGSVLFVYPPFGALFLMRELRTLTLHRWRSSRSFIHALDPNMGPSGATICPKLEELVLSPRDDEEGIDIESLIRMAAARASRGVKLRSVRVVYAHAEPKLDPADGLELGKHVCHVEYGLGVVRCGDEED